MTVLFIVLLHAIPVFVIAAWTKSRVALTVAAIISGVIGVAFGNPAYMAADLVGVAIAFFLGLSFTSSKQAQTPRMEEPVKEDDSPWVGVVVGALIVAAFLYNKATDNSAPSAPPAAQTPQQVDVMPNQKYAGPEPQAEIRMTGSHNKSIAAQDLRDCLHLQSNAEITKCANQEY